MNKRKFLKNLAGLAAIPLLPSIATAAPVVESTTYSTLVFKTAEKFFDIKSYIGTGGPTAVTLGWNPSLVVVKSVNQPGNWIIHDLKDPLPNTPGVQYTAFCFAHAAGQHINLEQLAESD